MAVNAYPYINGIDGPSTSKPQHIDVLGFTWGVNNQAVYGVGTSGKEAKAGRADFSTRRLTDVVRTQKHFGRWWSRCVHPMARARERCVIWAS
jgi:hypothetical protein